MTNDKSRGVVPFSTVPERLSEHLYRQCIPFEDIYTTVFVLTTHKGTAVLDSGSNGEDAERYIVPLLQRLHTEPQYLLCSHLHGDHNGGTAWLLQRYPTAKAILFSEVSPYPAERTIRAQDGDTLLDRFTLLHLPGHTPDAMAVYDRKDRILLTQDCFQKRGITKYGFGVTDIPAYLTSLEKVRTLSPDMLVAAHHFAPGGHIAQGREEIEAFLHTCIAVTEELTAFVAQYPTEPVAVVASRYNKTYPENPSIWQDRVETIRAYIEGRKEV